MSPVPTSRPPFTMSQLSRTGSGAVPGMPKVAKNWGLSMPVVPMATTASPTSAARTVAMTSMGVVPFGGRVVKSSIARFMINDKLSTTRNLAVLELCGDCH
jgi:hypothetical protein